MVSLSQTLERFNKGIQSFNEATRAYKTQAPSKVYEDYLRTAAIDGVGVLEWILKTYLQDNCLQSMSDSDRTEFEKRPDFKELCSFMKKYAGTVYDQEAINKAISYKNQFRNLPEHEGAVPPIDDLYKAILFVRNLIIQYLKVPKSKLISPQKPGYSENITGLKKRYFEFIRRMYKYLDLGGISPRVEGGIVKVSLEDIFTSMIFIEKENFLEMEVVATTEYREQLQMRWMIGEFLEFSPTVVLGGPGSGKSTLSKYLAWCLASNNFDLIDPDMKGFIPILVKTTDYAAILKSDPGLSVYEFITTRWHSEYCALFTWAIKNKKALVILDGLDEVSDVQIRNITNRRVEEFASEYPNIRLLITSRIIGYRKNRLSGDFTHLILQELDVEQIQEFLINWYKTIGLSSDALPDENVDDKANELFRAINNKPGVLKLASNPLLLTIIFLINWKGTRLPNRRVELYQISTETLVENWPLKQRGVSLDTQEVLDILKPVAYRILLDGNQNSISAYELEELLQETIAIVRGSPPQEARRISRDFLKLIEQDTGFFLERGTDENDVKVYGFFHQTFAEYLSACYLADQWSNGELDLEEIAYNQNWHEVFLLMAGVVGSWSPANSTRLIQNVLDIERPYGQHLHSNLFIAAEILANNVKVTPEIHNQILGDLIRLLINTSNSRLQRESLSRLIAIHEVAKISPNFPELEPHTDDEEIIIKIKYSLQYYLGNVSDLAFLNFVRILLDGESNLYHLLFWPEKKDPFQREDIFQMDSTVGLLVLSTKSFGRIIWLSRARINQIRNSNLNYIDCSDLLAGNINQEVLARNQLWIMEIDRFIHLTESELTKFISMNFHTEYIFEDGCELYYHIYSRLKKNCPADIQHANTTLKMIVDHTISKAVEVTNPHFLRNEAVDLILLLHRLFKNLSFDKSTTELERLHKAIDKLLEEDLKHDIHWRIARYLIVNIPFYEFELTDELFNKFLYALNHKNDIVQAVALWKISNIKGDKYPDVFKNAVKKALLSENKIIREAAIHSIIRKNWFSQEEIPNFIREYYGIFKGRLVYERIVDHHIESMIIDLLLLSKQINSSELLSVIGHRLINLIENISFDEQKYQGLDIVDNYRNKFNPSEDLAIMIEPLMHHPNELVRHMAINVFAILWPAKEFPESYKEILIDKSNPTTRGVAFSALSDKHFLMPYILDYALMWIEEDYSNIYRSSFHAIRKIYSIRNDEIYRNLYYRMADIFEENPCNIIAFDFFWRIFGPPGDTVYFWN